MSERSRRSRARSRELVRMLRAGSTKIAAARALGISYTAVVKLLHRDAPEFVRDRTAESEQMRERILACLTDGMTVRQAADELDLTPRSVLHRIRDLL